MKLQDAYVAENTALGTWKVIGYKQPGGTNFLYAEDPSTKTVTCASGTPKTVDDEIVGCDPKKDGDGKITEQGVVGTSTYAKAWSAENKAKLNDCAAGVNWNISATVSNASDEAGSVAYTATVSDDCQPLTPSFDKIGK